MAATHEQPLNDELWVELIRGIDQIRHFQAMSIPTYMKLYSLVYNYCTNTSQLQVSSNHGNGAHTVNSKAPGHAGGGELCKRLESHFQAYLLKLRQTSIDIHGEDLIRFYTKFWEQYEFSSKVINGFCEYINRYWVSGVQQNNEKNIHYIFTLSMLKWKEILCAALSERMTRTCLNWIQAERNHEMIDTRLIKTVIQSYVVLGHKLDKTEVKKKDSTTSETLDIYKEYFEVPFLQETEQFYLCEAVDILSKNSVTEYLRRVAQRLDEEERRVKSYLHPSTLQPLIKILDNVLIRDQLDVIYAEAETLLRNDKNQDLRTIAKGITIHDGREQIKCFIEFLRIDLALLFILVSRIPNAIDKLKQIVENHIYVMGMEAIANVSAEALKDADVYINTILDIYKKSITLIRMSFGGEHSSFIRALNNACSKFINKNAVTIAAGTSTKSPELLARFTDTLLRKSKGVDDHYVEERLQEIMIIFDYIEDKDIFQDFFSRGLAERLVNALSALEDYEKMMIINLETRCGFMYTSKLKKMIEDISVNKNLIAQYREYCEGQQLINTIDFSIMVLTTNAWPFSVVSNFALPLELTPMFDNFIQFYSHQHSNRRLTWLYQYSRGELHTYFTGSMYILRVSAYEIAILLLYNSSLEWTIEQIHEKTQIRIDILSEVLCILLQSKLLTCPQLSEKEVKRRNLKMEHTIRLNDHFTSQRTLINLNKRLKTTEQETTESVQRSTDEGRKFVVRAAIVRTMKARKTLKHTLLIQEVIEQLKDKFPPNISLIKHCIEFLLENEYLKRNSDDMDVLDYVA